MVSILELCDRVARERAAVQKIGQAASNEDISESLKSLVAWSAWAAEQVGKDNEDWQKVEERYFYLIVEIFGASEETALTLSKKLVTLTQEVCKK